LFTGDVTDKILKTVIEQELIKNIDILKVPHHGGKNTINIDILSQLGVKKAIISVGTNNYGHPNSDIIKIIESTKAEVLRTDIFGNIEIRAHN
jgi:competence protein ComEC